VFSKSDKHVVSVLGSLDLAVANIVVVWLRVAVLDKDFLEHRGLWDA
jgi:hypothetical protein